MATKNINVGKGLLPEIELFGDWGKALNLFNELPLAVNSGALEGKLKAAKRIREMVRRNIKSNGPPGVHWPELSKNYKTHKKNKGGDPNRKWFFKGKYYKNIRITEKGNDVFVGVPARMRGSQGKDPLTLGQIANILERGSSVRGIQARPLWGPTFKQFGGKRKVSIYITRNISNRVYLTTGVRPKILY